MNHNELIIDRLYYYLDKKNLTVNRIATLTGITQSTLSNVINRKSVPKVDMLYKICNVLDVSLKDFFDFPPYNEV